LIPSVLFFCSFEYVCSRTGTTRRLASGKGRLLIAPAALHSKSRAFLNRFSFLNAAAEWQDHH
jgi:hypothetical protein